jgi:putative DeoR family transcriptional regulator (stage III sporulation protein D)|nr:MAG TPA: Stage III sporulation protein D [Caudoviricetes sp.]
MSKVKERIEKRVRAEAEFIISSESTIRDVAKYFGVSKSTVHRDLTERIKSISPIMARGTKIILEYNKSIRHLRGGLSNKNKWRNKDVRDVA